MALLVLPTVINNLTKTCLIFIIISNKLWMYQIYFEMWIAQNHKLNVLYNSSLCYTLYFQQYVVVISSKVIIITKWSYNN